jgi:hypothetical protein
LGFWDFGILGFWDFGILGFWDFGILGFWDFGILGFWVLTYGQVSKSSNLCASRRPNWINKK